MYTINDGDDKSTKQLKKCISSTCETIAANEGFYMDGDTKTSDGDSYIYKKLIECKIGEDGTMQCTSVPARGGIRIDAGSLNASNKYNQLIKCTGGSICTGSSSGSQCAKNSSSNGNRLGSSSGGRNSDILGCIYINRGATESSVTHYLSENVDDESDEIISCYNDGCIYEDKKVQGYFLNSDDDGIIIMCEDEECVLLDDEDIEDECSEAGDLMKNNNGIFLCISENEEDNHIKVVSEINISGYPQYLTLNNAESDFPGVIYDTHIVKIDNDGSIILLEETSLPNCSEDKCVKDNYCIDENIIKTGSSAAVGTCNAITNSEAGTVNLYFDYKGNKVNEPNISTNDIMVYKCTFKTPTELSSCVLFKGHFTKGSSVIQCNGWRREGCFVTIVNYCTVSNGSNCNSNSYYLVDSEDNNKIINNNNKYGYLFYCSNENMACTRISDVGYYVVDSSIIYDCLSSNTGILCKLDNYYEECNNDSIGKIIYKDKKLSICINNEIIVDITTTSKSDYVVSKGNGNIFISSNDEEDYAIISINEQVVTLNTKYSNGLKYVYVNKGSNGNYKVMKNTDTCPKNNSNIIENDILELECTNGKCKEVDDE